MRVYATAELIGIDGRTLSFRVEARDEREPIGDGQHGPAVLNAASFTSGCEKARRAGAGGGPGCCGCRIVAPGRPLREIVAL